jgi:hypothetical protein
MARLVWAAVLASLCCWAVERDAFVPLWVSIRAATIDPGWQISSAGFSWLVDLFGPAERWAPVIVAGWLAASIILSSRTCIVIASIVFFSPVVVILVHVLGLEPMPISQSVQTPSDVSGDNQATSIGGRNQDDTEVRTFSAPSVLVLAITGLLFVEILLSKLHGRIRKTDYGPVSAVSKPGIDTRARSEAVRIDPAFLDAHRLMAEVYKTRLHGNRLWAEVEPARANGPVRVCVFDRDGRLEQRLKDAGITLPVPTHPNVTV